MPKVRINVGFTALPPNFHCWRWCFSIWSALGSNVRWSSDRHMLAYSAFVGSSGCSIMVTPPLAAMFTSSRIPLSIKRLPVHICLISLTLRYCSPQRSARVRKGRGPLQMSESSRAKWRAADQVSHGGPLIPRATAPLDAKCTIDSNTGPLSMLPWIGSTAVSTDNTSTSKSASAKYCCLSWCAQ